MSLLTIELLIAGIAVITSLIIFIGLKIHGEKQQKEINELDKRFERIIHLAS